MIRADHPSYAERGGVCIFYKKTLGVCVVNLSNLSDCIICEVSIQNNKGYICAVYRSPSQDAIEFQNLLPNFETILSDTATNVTTDATLDVALVFNTSWYFFHFIFLICYNALQQVIRWYILSQRYLVLESLIKTARNKVLF